jgi:hypothetical protein
VNDELGCIWKMALKGSEKNQEHFTHVRRYPSWESKLVPHNTKQVCQHLNGFRFVSSSCTDLCVPVSIERD